MSVRKAFWSPLHFTKRVTEIQRGCVIYPRSQCLQMAGKVKVKMLVGQSCLTPSNPMECRPPGSSIHGIPQARMLQWVAISFSMGSTWPRDWTWVSCIAGGFFTACLSHHLEFNSSSVVWVYTLNQNATLSLKMVMVVVVGTVMIMMKMLCPWLHVEHFPYITTLNLIFQQVPSVSPHLSTSPHLPPLSQPSSFTWTSEAVHSMFSQLQILSLQSHCSMKVRNGPQRLSAMLSMCGAGEDSQESHEQQDQTSQL